MIYHLLYLSQVTSAFIPERDLELILGKSRINNQKRQVTGLLIQNGQYFLQLLEGKREDVEQIYKRISQDARHGRIRSLMDFESERRLFPQWAMGLAVKAQMDMHMPELIPLLHADVLKEPSSRARVLTILRRFNDIQ